MRREFGRHTGLSVVGLADEAMMNVREAAVA
jgi:hypothetical protein